MAMQKQDREHRVQVGHRAKALPRHIGNDAHDRADREVDVAGHDDDGLAHRHGQHHGGGRADPVEHPGGEVALDLGGEEEDRGEKRKAQGDEAQGLRRGAGEEGHSCPPVAHA
jgi:hypothetical protein